MKLILIVTAIVLLPVGIVTKAWADTAHPVQPDAASLNTSPAEVVESSDDEADRLDGLADRINQSLGHTSRSSQSESMPSVNEILNLPEDTVVRGTSRGGLAIGREF